MSTAYKRLSVADFLALEQSADQRHEFYDGEVFAMAGGTVWHSLITANVSAELRAALKKRGCLTLSSDIMVACPSGLRTYPDVTVVCERPEFEGDRQVTLLNPQAIVEVLSESTEAYDRGKKFEHYRGVASLREYLLVSQDYRHIEHFTRQADGQWLLRMHGDDPGGHVGGKRDGKAGDAEPPIHLSLPTLGCTLSLDEVYAGVEFPPPKPEPFAAEQPPAAEAPPRRPGPPRLDG
ncbi:MAG: Uma2 family endonuclease [Planctomycetota bacterium]